MRLPDQPAPPGQWHPFYDDKRWLRDWLDGRGPHARYATLQVPRPITFTAAASDGPPLDGPPLDLDVNDIWLTRHRAWGPAPYVGDPFVYQWWVGVDTLGRQIAGDRVQIVKIGEPAASALHQRLPSA